MTTTRSCATCAAFSPVHTIDQPGCGNLVSFIVSPDRNRDPGLHPHSSAKVVFRSCQFLRFWQLLTLQFSE